MEYSDDDHRLAAQLADGAGRLLVEMRTSMLADGSDAAEVKLTRNSFQSNLNLGIKARGGTDAGKARGLCAMPST